MAWYGDATPVELTTVARWLADPSSHALIIQMVKRSLIGLEPEPHLTKRGEYVMQRLPAGFIEQHTCRGSKTRMTIYDGYKSGVFSEIGPDIDEDGRDNNRFVVICEPHGTHIAGGHSLKLARAAAKDKQWCPVCTGEEQLEENPNASAVTRAVKPGAEEIERKHEAIAEHLVRLVGREPEYFERYRTGEVWLKWKDDAGGWVFVTVGRRMFRGGKRRRRGRRREVKPAWKVTHLRPTPSGIGPYLSYLAPDDGTVRRIWGEKTYRDLSIKEMAALMRSRLPGDGTPLPQGYDFRSPRKPNPSTNTGLVARLKF